MLAVFASKCTAQSPARLTVLKPRFTCTLVRKTFARAMCQLHPCAAYCPERCCRWTHASARAPKCGSCRAALDQLEAHRSGTLMHTDKRYAFSLLHAWCRVRSAVSDAVSSAAAEVGMLPRLAAPLLARTPAWAQRGLDFLAREAQRLAARDPGASAAAELRGPERRQTLHATPLSSHKSAAGSQDAETCGTFAKL